MKIWRGYGSEHSSNLVMIGRFQEATDATGATGAIQQLTEQVLADLESGLTELGEPADRFTQGMLDLLSGMNLMILGPAEVEQFAYDVTVETEGNRVLVRTDEIDVSAFLKVLIDKGARVEVYSAHSYPDADRVPED